MSMTLAQTISRTSTAMRRYGQVLGAMFRFEQEARFHSPIESILALLEPVVVVGSLVPIFWIVDRKSPLQIDPVLFVTTGIFPIYFFMHISQRMLRVVSTHQRRFPVEERLDQIIVHIMIGTIDFTILGIIGFGLLYFAVGADAFPKDFKLIALAAANCIMIGFGWGIFNMVIVKWIKIWQFIVPALNRHFIIISGVFYVADFLPPTARNVLSYNPLTEIVVLFRLGFFPTYPKLVLDMHYLTLFSIFAVAVGLVAERLSRRREEQ